MTELSGTGTGAARGKRRMTLSTKRSIWGYAFISPWIVGILVFFLWPMCQTVIYSFSKISVSTNGTGFVTTFVGWKNFLYFFTQETNFFPYLSSAVIGIIPQVILILCFSMFIAVILKQKFIGRTVARAVFFFPVIIASGVVITILKEQVMMSGSTVTNAEQQVYLFKAPDMLDAFTALGLPSQLLTLLTNVLNQMFDLTWKSGVQILLLLAAVNNIPSSFYEVAVIEGATAWEKFWKITFPTVAPTLLVAVIYTIIDSFTDYGNKMMGMLRDYYTKGVYEYSSTIGLLYFVCILAIIGLVNLIASRAISYEAD